MKICRKCHKIKETAEFTRCDKGKDGLMTQCKSCRRQLNNTWSKAKYNNETDKIKERNRNWRLDNPEKSMLSQCRGSAKSRGLEFNLTIEDMVIPEFCPVLGIKLEKSIGRPSANSPSIDRIDNSLGYIKGNIIIVSRRANVIKSDATIEELEALASFYRSLRPLISKAA